MVKALQHEFARKDLGLLHHFLGIIVKNRSDTLFLQQRRYTFVEAKSDTLGIIGVRCHAGP